MSDWPWRRRSSDEGPNLTPMVDVIFQLVVFLILMASFTDEPAIKINLPEAGTAAVVETTVPRIYLARDGQLFWNGESLPDLTALSDKISDYASRVESKEIKIMADEGVAYGKVINVIDRCRAKGLIEMVLGMEQAPLEQPQ